MDDVRFSMSLSRQFGELRHGAVEHTPAILFFGAFEFTADMFQRKPCKDDGFLWWTGTWIHLVGILG